VNDRRFRDLPMLLETPKGEGKATGPIGADPLDVRNLETLRGLVGRRAPEDLRKIESPATINRPKRAS
jgi:hypothetical protein